MDYFGDGTEFDVNIEYFREITPLGSAGALFKLRESLTEDFLLLNADVIFDIDFNRMLQFHREHDALVTLFTHPNSHPYDSGLIIASENGSVEKWLAKEDERPVYYNNKVNAGLHVINPAVLDMMKIHEETSKIDLDRQVLKPLAGTGKMFCYDSPEYVKDMGTPECFYAVEADFLSGKVKAKNLFHKQRAVFLDHDGTINKYVGFLHSIEQFELLDGAAEAIKMINESCYLCIVVTNQPVIARGEVTVAQLDEIHRKMETLLGFEGSYIDGLYYCPHHPHRGCEGEVAALKMDCECHKLKPGMLLKAAEDFAYFLRRKVDL